MKGSEGRVSFVGTTSRAYGVCMQFIYETVVVVPFLLGLGYKRNPVLFLSSQPINDKQWQKK